MWGDKSLLRRKKEKSADYVKHTIDELDSAAGRETGRLVAKVVSSVQSYKTDLEKSRRKKPRPSVTWKSAET